MTLIVQEGDPVLRKEAKPVPEKLFKTKELADLIRAMSEALDEEPDGVALAAPQIGVSYRIFIVRKDRTIPHNPETPEDRAPEVDIYINPEITKTSRKRHKADEGCLSVRGQYGATNRHEKVSVRARNVDGTKFERGASGLVAQIFEHEIDHLNGILFIDEAVELYKVPHTEPDESN